MLSSTLIALAASLSVTSAQVYKGFNYGATNTDNSPITESQYQNDFTTAQNLVGASGFTSGRLYTSIQAGTTDTYTEAFQAVRSLPSNTPSTPTEQFLTGDFLRQSIPRPPFF